MDNIKVLFLDIDGVLNSNDYFNSIKNNQDEYEEIDESKVILLKKIIDKTNAKIVLSSTWRELNHRRLDKNNPKYDGNNHPMFQYLIDILKKYGLEIYSEIPIIDGNRPHEICEWIKQNNFKGNFVSIEDDFGFDNYKQYGIEYSLISTSFYLPKYGGLQQEHVEKAIKKLANIKKEKNN